jgi:predicted nucleic acid-binding protein
VLIDTDVLIEAERGNRAASQAIGTETDRFISTQTALEFLQGARDAEAQRLFKRFLSECGVVILPLTENIGHRALIYIEEYALSHGLRAGDALVAATAVENAQPLLTGNARHFRPIKELDVVPFRRS